MFKLGYIASAIAKAISDLFTRTTTGSLGSATSGQTWQATRGTWNANGSQATSSDAASSYPLASIPIKTDVTVSATVSDGNGVAVWVSDASNWYAVVSYNTQTGFSCGCGTCCSTCSHTGGSCGSTPNTCTNQDCTACGSTTVNNYTQTNPANFTCAELGYSATSSANCPGLPGGWSCCFTGTSSVCNTCSHTGGSCGSTNNTCTNADCSACGSFSCGCSTCYTTNFFLRMLKSVAGTVSTVVSDVSVASDPIAVKAVTNGNTISGYAYSDTSLTTQIGTITSTPASPTKGNAVGIIKTPATTNQGSTVDTFAAN